MESSPDRRGPARRGARPTARGRGPDGARDAELRAELAAIYQRADDLAAATTHDGCTRCAGCCQFARLGREPYVTSIEIEVLLRSWRRLGGKVKRLARSDGLGDELKICPLLTAELHCAAYRDRPLGCRTFWCRAAESEARAADRRAVLALVRQVQALAERHQAGGEQGRPLWAALRAMARNS